MALSCNDTLLVCVCACVWHLKIAIVRMWATWKHIKLWLSHLYAVCLSSFSCTVLVTAKIAVAVCSCVCVCVWERLKWEAAIFPSKQLKIKQCCLTGKTRAWQISLKGYFLQQKQLFLPNASPYCSLALTFQLLTFFSAGAEAIKQLQLLTIPNSPHTSECYLECELQDFFSLLNYISFWTTSKSNVLII